MGDGLSADCTAQAVALRPACLPIYGILGPCVGRRVAFAFRLARQASYTRLVKLVVAVVHNEDARTLIDALLAHEFRATWLHSTGGFLKQSNATILLGVDEDKVEEVVSLVRQHCHSRTQTVSPIMPIMEPGEFFMPYPLEVDVGGAVVFVVQVDRFERI